MPQTRPNKMKTIVNSDAYNLAADLATTADSANVLIPVANQTERDGLAALMAGTLPVPTMVYRADLNAYESWNGATWDRVVTAIAGTAVSDGFWTITGGLIKTVTGTLTQVTASLVLTRTGPAITIATTDSTLITGLIPSGFRPSGNFGWVGSLNTNTGTRYAEPQLVMNTGGSLVARSTSGGSVLVSTGYVVFVGTTWFI